MSKLDMNTPRSWLTGALHPGPQGNAGPEPMKLGEIPQAIFQLTARKGMAAQLAQQMTTLALPSAEPGLALPPAGRAHFRGDVTAIAIAPATWMISAPRAHEAALTTALAATVGDTGSLVPQTWGKVTLRLSGANARETLLKGCRVDLHPRAFVSGSAAATIIAHINTLVVQRDDAPTYDLIMAATLSETFLEWLVASAAAYGCLIEG